MMTERTPGPWEAEAGQPMAGDDWVGVYAEDAVPGHKMPAMCYGPEQDANARLIAAAPELLEALRRVLDTNNGGEHGENIEGWLDARRDAVSAIAKAEGTT